MEEKYIIDKESIKKNLIIQNSNYLYQAHKLKVIQSRYVTDIALESNKTKILEGIYNTRKDKEFNELAQGLKYR